MKFGVHKAAALLACVSTALISGSAVAQPARKGERAVKAAHSAATYEKTFFEHSLLESSRTEARQALARNHRNLNALFVEMEAAALEADTPAVLEAAARIVALPMAQRDQRADIAAARIYDLAANSPEFAHIVPTLLAVIAHRGPQDAVLREALVKAGADGLRGINVEESAKAAGLLTEWRAAGPFGDYAKLDFNRAFAPQQDMLMGSMSDGRPVELFRFADAMVRLPDYFGTDGVYYGMSEAQVAGGAYEVRVESAGTLEVFIDGKSVLRHDSRFRELPSTAVAPVRLERGTHKVLVKFLGTAGPFRISVARREPAAAPTSIAYGPEAQYVAASHKFWEGDLSGAVEGLQRLCSEHESAACDWMLFRSWTKAEKGAPEASTLLASILRLTPEALVAQYELASRAFQAGSLDEALSHLTKVLGRRAEFAPAEDLMGQIAMRMHMPVEAEHAIEILVHVHPSCAVLLRAQHFFVHQALYDRARQIDSDLSECGSDSIAFANSLSESGRHADAAMALQQVVARNPLDRVAREKLAREMALAGNGDAARKAIDALAALAPNSPRYRQMATRAHSDPLTLLDDPSAETSTAEEQPFYAPYRRDGVAVVQEAADRHFSGGPALMLLDDKISRVWPDGSVSVYTHRITRALDRGGVEKWGEVSIPAGADVLELRTIRQDGTVLEPELTPDKATISMPGLLPGDAVDEEYVLHYGSNDDNFASAFAHTFGSFRAPILASRFILLTPKDQREIVEASTSAPSMSESRTGDVNARIWEMKNIAQSVGEMASANGDILPTVRITPALPRGWEDVRDDERELALEAAQAGPRVQAAVRGLQAATDEQLARSLYRLVNNSVRSTTSEFGADLPSAEQTLAMHAGSRTVALLALANAAGLHADLVLARDAGTLNVNSAPSEDVYTRPLVRFTMQGSGGEREVIVDAESDGLPFGMLPPSIVRSDSLLVTLPSEKMEAKVEPAILRLPGQSERDESFARAEVTIAPNGDLSADISILVGAWRGMEMRDTLEEAGAQREEFFERLAHRIFPDAENVTGEVRNEDDPDRTLEITLHCTSPQYVDLASGSADLEQIVPNLGLKSMYPAVTGRKFPLYVGSPLFESATFRIHLPDGVTVTHPATDVREQTPFGSYSLTFREPEPRILEITRSFDVPVQVVEPGKLAQFAAFAGRIETAERQKIGLAVDRSLARVGQ